MPLPLLQPLNLPELAKLDGFAEGQADQLMEWSALPADVCLMYGQGFNGWHLPQETLAAWTRGLYGPRREKLVVSWAWSKELTAWRNRYRTLRAFPEIERRETIYSRIIGGRCLWEFSFADLQALTERTRQGQHIGGVREGRAIFRAYDFQPTRQSFYSLNFETNHTLMDGAVFARHDDRTLQVENATIIRGEEPPMGVPRPHPRGEGL